MKPGSNALQTLRMNKEMIPASLDVMNIGSTGDTVAMPESVQTLKHIVREDQLLGKMIEDATLGHSELHENSQIDKLIHSFLFSKNAANDVK